MRLWKGFAMSERELTKEIAAAQALKQSLVALGADEETLRDTIEGGTSLHEMIAAVFRDLTECEIMENGLSSVIDQMIRRRDAVINRKERLRACIEHAMAVGEIKTLTLPEATITLKAVPPKLTIQEECDIPAEYWVPVAPRLDKKALTSALKSGASVPGAALDNGGITLQIRR